MRFDVHPTAMKQKQGAPCGRTLPKATDDSDMHNRAFPVGNALFFFAGSVMSLFRLPRQACVCAATKAPVGLLSDRTVLR